VTNDNLTLHAHLNLIESKFGFISTLKHYRDQDLYLKTKTLRSDLEIETNDSTRRTRYRLPSHEILGFRISVFVTLLISCELHF